MTRALPLVSALALVVAAGLVHGRLTRRWTPSRGVEAAVARLGRVPKAVGDWECRWPDFEIGRAQQETGEIAGYVVRRYRDRRTGDVVTLMLVCGAPGPIAQHTPDFCYVGAGYDLTGPISRRTLPLGRSGNPAVFRHAVFGKTTSAVPTYLSIFWSWSHAGVWEAPESPRTEFAPRQALYKLYAIRETATAEGRLEDEPIMEFLKALAPELEQALFANP
jgi:hypothetical protein